MERRKKQMYMATMAIQKDESVTTKSDRNTGEGTKLTICKSDFKTTRKELVAKQEEIERLHHVAMATAREVKQGVLSSNLKLCN